MIDLTARQQGYYVVYVEGARYSQHVQEREAVENGVAIKLADPSLRVHYAHPYHVDVEITDAEVDLPSPSQVPSSDAGEDLIDFLERIQGEPVDVDFIDTTNLSEALQVFAEQTKQTWLIRRLYIDMPDRGREWIGVGWRGYVLLFYLRDRGALRIGGGS